MNSFLQKVGVYCYSLNRVTSEGRDILMHVIASVWAEHRFEILLDKEYEIAGLIWGEVPFTPIPRNIKVDKLTADYKVIKPLILDALKMAISAEEKIQKRIEEATPCFSRKNKHINQITSYIGDCYSGLYVDDYGHRYVNNSQDVWLFGFPNYKGGDIKPIVSNKVYKFIGEMYDLLCIPQESTKGDSASTKAV